MPVEELPPEPQLVESMRSVGYSVETALADIVDNSISANATNVTLRFEGQPQPRVLVLDDGDGMTKDELRTAMKLAGKSPNSARKKHDLGRFGLGLKTASFSQAKRLTVISKTIDSDLSAACWDLDVIEQQNKWLLDWLDPSSIDSALVALLKEQNSGTLVVWEKLDQVSSSPSAFDAELRDQALRVRDHLGLVFHRFIDGPPGGRVSFTLNENAVEAIDPFFSRFQATQQKPTTEVELAGGTIVVTPFILPHVSQLSKSDAKALESLRNRFKDSQGFYVYRGKRLISHGSWFRLSPKTELAKMARVRVDTPNSLDKDWKLGIMKSSVEPPPELRRILANLVPNIIGDSRRVVLRRGAKAHSSSSPTWQFREIGPRLFALELNREHPLLASLVEMLSKDQVATLELLIEQIEAGIPSGELVSRLSSDQALGQEDLDMKDLDTTTAQLFERLRPRYGSVEEVIKIISNLEPYATNPIAQEKLRVWTEEVEKEVKSVE